MASATDFSALETAAAGKKTKALASGELIDRIAFQVAVSFGSQDDGGLFSADRGHIHARRFPSRIPSQCNRADG